MPVHNGQLSISTANDSNLIRCLDIMSVKGTLELNCFQRAATVLADYRATTDISRVTWLMAATVGPLPLAPEQLGRFCANCQFNPCVAVANCYHVTVHIDGDVCEGSSKFIVYCTKGTMVFCLPPLGNPERFGNFHARGSTEPWSVSSPLLAIETRRLPEC